MSFFDIYIDTCHVCAMFDFIAMCHVSAMFDFIIIITN